MGSYNAWRALRQRPWQLLASPWPWRSLAYLLCGIAPSGAVVGVLLALLAWKARMPAPSCCRRWWRRCCCPGR
jgi:hypothetical protein